MLRSSHRFTRTLLPLCGALVALAAASPASAATVEKTAPGNNIFLKGGPGENNSLDVWQAGPNVHLQDPNATLDEIGGCAQVDAHHVECPAAGLQSIFINVEGGTNDVSSTANYYTQMHGLTAAKNTFSAVQSQGTLMTGGPGRDTLTGSAGDDVLDGRAGEDVLDGGSDDDELRGGDGFDDLYPGEGADTVLGEADADTVFYDDRVAPVHITLFDNLANDGITGEGDNVKSDVENVKGGEGNDTITGTSGQNFITGGEGRDTISGGGGLDALSGEAGEDNLHGQAGTDDISGGIDGDYIDGGSDTDSVTGDAGSDTILGGAGTDTLNGGSGNDAVKGGSENDNVNGGADNDTLVGEGGADKVIGGTGEDTLTYPGVTAPLMVDLDGVDFDDGAAGEGDSAGIDIERVTGGSGADVLTGNASANVLRGGGGNDTLDGLGGSDSLFGELGDDNLLSRDGATDTDDCGAGSDTFSADAVDTLVACEPPAGQGGAAQGGGAVAARTTTVGGPALRIGPGRVRLNRRGEATLRVSCSAKAKSRCIGTLKLQRKAKGKTSTIGSKRFSIKAGRSGVVRIKLSRRMQRSIGRRGMQVKAVGSARDVVSAARTTSRKVTISRARR